MSDITEVISKLVSGEIKEGFVSCLNKSHQESVRVMVFNEKNKLSSELKELITVSKFSEDGQLYIKVYKKPNLGILVRDENGKLVPLNKNPEDSPELQRILKLMKEDGRSQEEINEVIKQWEDEQRE